MQLGREQLSDIPTNVSEHDGQYVNSNICIVGHVDYIINAIMCGMGTCVVEAN